MEVTEIWLQSNQFNPLTPKQYLHTILQTELQTISQRISWENIIIDQSIFPLVVLVLILITFSFDDVLVLSGENSCWSLLGLKGLGNHVIIRWPPSII